MNYDEFVERFQSKLSAEDWQALEDYIEMEKDESYSDGVSACDTDSYDAGYSDGYEDGHKDGYDQGYTEGCAED